MGCTTSEVRDYNNENEFKIFGDADSPPVKHDVEYWINKQKTEFPDMEEWEGERYKGIGIKRMKGYKCTLQIDK